jgi:hypothetical protein
LGRGLICSVVADDLSALRSRSVDFLVCDMSTNENEKTGEQDGRIAALRESIRRSFPAEPYRGKVTPNDGEWTPELDEDQDLYGALNARRWTEVPTQLLHSQPDAYVLLTDQAFAAFLPAWLMFSLEDMDAENEVRNFLVYAFSNTLRQFRVLNPEQRLTVRSLLEEFAERETSAPIRALATQAVALIDSQG